MKITANQLRKIIKEEAKRVREGMGMDSSGFYGRKLKMLEIAQNGIDRAIGALEDIHNLETQASGGDPEEIREMIDALEQCAENIEGYTEAVEAMT